MQYPFEIFSEWRPTNEPLFSKTKNGDEYCVVTIGKSFKGSGGELIRDAVKIQCFGEECNTLKAFMEKHDGVKGLPLDVYADRIPYVKAGAIEYSHRATKIAIASSFYFAKDNKKEVPIEKTKPQLLMELEEM